MSPQDYGCKIFKPCEKKCERCEACREFKKVASQIDLQKKSKHSLMTPRIWAERD